MTFYTTIGNTRTSAAASATVIITNVQCHLHDVPSMKGSSSYDINRHWQLMLPSTPLLLIYIYIWYICSSIGCCSGKQYYQLTAVTRLYWYAVWIFTAIQLRVNREADKCKTCKIYALSIVFLLQYQTDTHVILKGVAYMHIKFFIKHIAYRGVDYLHACADVYLQFSICPFKYFKQIREWSKNFLPASCGYSRSHRLPAIMYHNV